MIIEVLSESTRRTDEGEKLGAYQKIDTLSVYLMFDQEMTVAVVYRRSGSEFRREAYSSIEAVILLPEISAELRLASVYAEVNFVAESGSP